MLSSFGKTGARWPILVPDVGESRGQDGGGALTCIVLSNKREEGKRRDRRGRDLYTAQENVVRRKK